MNEQSFACLLIRSLEEIYRETEKRVDDDQYTSEERYFFIIIFSSLLKRNTVLHMYIYTVYDLSLSFNNDP